VGQAVEMRKTNEELEMRKGNAISNIECRILKEIQKEMKGKY
jgi:hypothetical protein